MRLLPQVLATVLLTLSALPALAEEKAPLEAASFFAPAPLLTFEQTEPVTVDAVVKPVVFALSSGGEPGKERISCYLGGIGKLVEIPLDGGAVKEHAMPFDHGDNLGLGGVYAAVVGPDECIYLLMQSKPGSLARFNPATSAMEHFSPMGDFPAQSITFGPQGKAYLGAYLATLIEFDMKTGAFRNLGRVGENEVYLWDGWVGPDGYFYCDPSRTKSAATRINLTTGQHEKIDILPARVLHPDTPASPHANLTKQFDVSMIALPGEVTVTIRGKGAAADAPPLRVASFTPSTNTTNLSTLVMADDGRIYGSGLHRQFIFDPKSGAIDRPNFRHSIADFAVVGSRVYFSGYPHATLGVYDTTRPLTVPFDGLETPLMAKLGDPASNPRQIVALSTARDASAAEPEKILFMNRLWILAAAPDGRLFMGATSSRHSRGGALAAWNPADNSVAVWRTPHFLQLGVRAVCPVNNWKQLAVATWVSADVKHPEQTPTEARLFLFDVARGEMEWSGVPLPGCKVLTGIIQAPAPGTAPGTAPGAAPGVGTNRLIGVGLPSVTPTDKDDDSFYADATVFIFDLDERRTVATFPLAFRVGLREGRPFVVAPDGTVWATGGIGGSVIHGPHDGGIFRMDADALTVTPVARVEGTVGNFLFLGKTMYMVGGDRLRWADVSGLLKAQ